MFKHLSENMKLEIKKALIKRYDENNKRLQAPFLKMYYDEDDIELMIKENEKIDKLLEELNKE